MREDTKARERLLKAARAEFACCGYQKASLRTMSREAGLSTGAVYFFFGGKEELFHAVVDEAAAELRRLLTKGARREYAGDASGEENDRAVEGWLQRYPKEAAILLERAEDSPAAGFRAEMMSLLEESFMLFFERGGGQKADAPLIRLLVEQRVQALLELAALELDPQVTMNYAVLLGAWGEAGFQGMMQRYAQIQKGPAG